MISWLRTRNYALDPPDRVDSHVFQCYTTNAMKCEVCGLKEAVIHIRQVFPSGVQEVHVCEECAQEKGFSRDREDAETPELSISNLLTGLIEFREPHGEVSRESCPRCGLTVQEFRKRGKLGCSECFSAFAVDVRAALSQMTGRTHHTGKYPRRLSTDPGIAADRERLKTDLKDALDREEYEKAAHLRDRIKELGPDV
jgi:protein arginine kinase activator